MLNFLPGVPNELKPRITVIGVGGAGGNAVNNMILSRLEGVEFMVANTDAQSLGQSRTERRIQLGTAATQGLGAGSRPDIGRAAAEESIEEILGQIGGANMVFITAGMGGGTGTGAAPVIARAAREKGILTVGVVTKPFHFEGAHRMRTAEAGIEELQQYVDTLIIIPNQNLFRVATERTTFADAFKMADDVLYSGVRGVTDLMIMPGLINLDFADIRTVMSEMGKAMMGTGEAEGDKRAIDAAEAAISNPLLDDTSMKGAKGVLINITGGLDMTLFEVDEAANRIRDEVDPEANIIFGSTFDEKLNGKMRVSVVATGIASEALQHPKPAVISLVNTPAPAPRPMPVAQTSPFRPQVVTAAAPQPATVPEQVAFRTAIPAPVQQAPAMSQAAMRQAVEPELDIRQPEPPVRAEPTFARHDMAALGKAVSEIAESAANAAPPAPMPQAQPEPRRGAGNLFDRLMRSRQQPAVPQPQPQHRAPAREELVAAPQPRRDTAPRGGEDLDIPAFLRRQSN